MTQSGPRWLGCGVKVLMLLHAGQLFFTRGRSEDIVNRQLAIGEQPLCHSSPINEY